jgi:hypothetical protein
MVGLFKTFLPLLLATFAAATSLQITQPSSSIWWVAKSQNVLAWNCQSGTDSVTNFTVLISNVNPSILAAPLAIIAIQQNFDCSIIITQDEASQPAATGYTILFANPLNNTDVYATSEQFEIKPLGSLYPSQVSSSASAPGGTGTGTGTSSPSASPTKSGALDAHSPSFIGLLGIMALMAAGLLGA